VVAVLGPRDGFGYVAITVALRPFGVEVQFHLPHPLYLANAYIAAAYVT
jgi:hypothetical protein